MATSPFDLQRFRAERLRRARELYVAIFLGASLLLGFVGFLGQRSGGCVPEGKLGLQRVLDAAHCTLQLITLNVSARETQDWMLTLARWLVPGATLLLAFLAIVDRLPQWWVSTIVRRSSPKVLVLGCGSMGLRLANFYACKLLDEGKLRRALVGIDQDLGSPRTEEFKDSGFTLIEAPLNAADTLERLALGACERIVICTGDDTADLALAKRAHARAPHARILISVEDEAAHQACRLDPELTEAYSSGKIQLFSGGHLEARLLLLKWAPHHVWPDRFRAGSSNPCHIGIYASGTFVDDLAAQAVRALVYNPDEANPLRITIFIANKDEASRRLFGKHPILRELKQVERQHPSFGAQLPLATVHFVESHPLHLDAAAVIEAHGARRIDVLYVHGESAMLTRVMIAEAVKACDVLADERPAVVGCLHEDDEYPVNDDQGLPWLLFFRMGAWSSAAIESLASTPDDLHDHAAIVLKRAYDRAVEGKGGVLRAPDALVQVTDQDVDAWTTLPHAERWMNRHGADHALVKLALLGIQAPLPQSLVCLEQRLGDDECHEWLSRVEHRRYVCERMVDGWLRRSSEKSVNDYHLNITLKTFEQLDKDYQQYDRYFVDALKVVLPHQAKRRPVRTIALAGHNAIDLMQVQRIREGVDRELTALAENEGVKTEHWRLLSPLAPGSDYVLTGAALLWLLKHSGQVRGPASYSLDVCQGLEVDALVVKWNEHVGAASCTPDGVLTGSKITLARVEAALAEVRRRASLVLPKASTAVPFAQVLATNDDYVLEHADELIVAVSGKRLELSRDRLTATTLETLAMPAGRKAGALALASRWLEQDTKAKPRLDSLHVIDIG